MVEEEIKGLPDEPTTVIYKQFGPCLIKQEVKEVKLNVKKRIEFISAEM